MDALKEMILEKLDMNEIFEQLNMNEIIGDKIEEIVLEFVKDKVPENMQGMVEEFIKTGEKPDLDSLLGGDDGKLDLGDAVGIAKKFFGK